MQLDEQSVSPAPQPSPQTPIEHTCPVAHTVPQSPQCNGLDDRSTHPSAHIQNPAWHWQEPPTQLWPAAHALAQAPQWVLSLSSATHPASPQNHCPGAQGASPAVPPEEVVEVPWVVVEDEPPLLVLPVVVTLVAPSPAPVGDGGGGLSPLQAATSRAADIGTIDWLSRRIGKRDPEVLPQ
jgi:hypothetical protein